MNSPNAPLPELIRRWQHGWGMCRGLRRPKETTQALHVTLKLPGRHHETIALHADAQPDTVADLIATTRAASQPTWLTIPTNNVEAAARACTDAGLELMGEPEQLMTTDLRHHPDRSAHEPYTVGTADDGKKVIQALATTPDGLVAASGLMAVSGTDAVAHAIRTNEDHRRQGLASAIMSALIGQAREAGARTGLLVASQEGAALYASLGWKVKADVVSARMPVTLSHQG